MGKTIDEILINKKIKVTPIIRGGGNLPKGHDGEFMFTDATFSTTVPLDSQRKTLVEVLTPDERKAFEEEFQLPSGTMSFYNRENPYWAKYRVKLGKEGKVLDLSKPTDYIEYKVLLANKRIIAPSWESRFNSGEYKFALVDEDEQLKSQATKTEILKNAWKHFGKLEDSVEDMKFILGTTNKKTTSSKIEFLRTEIGKMIETNVNQFLAIVEDPKFRIKVFIEKCLNKNILERNSNSGYALKGGDEIGRTLQETIAFLESPKNQDIYLKLKAQIENSK